ELGNRAGAIGGRLVARPLKAQEGLVKPRALEDAILCPAGIRVDVQQAREGECVICSVKERAKVPSVAVVARIHAQFERGVGCGVVVQLPKEQRLSKWGSKVAAVLGEVVRGEGGVTRGDSRVDGDGT